MSRRSASGSRSRRTTFSPKSVGRTDTRKSMSRGVPRSFEPRLDAAVLRQPLLGDVEPRHDLHARDDGVAVLERRRHHRLQHAVDAEPDPHFLFVRLDVDVARALLNRRQHQRVDELDDRRLAALPLERRGVDFLGVVDDLEVAVVRRGPSSSSACETMSALIALPFGRRRRVGLREVLRDRLADRRLGGDDRLDVQARQELDVVHREDVGRIRHRERQRRPGLADGNDVVLGGGLGRNQADDGGVEIEFLEVDRRHAVLPAEDRRDVFVGEDAELDETAPRAGRRSRADGSAPPAAGPA